MYTDLNGRQIQALRGVARKALDCFWGFGETEVWQNDFPGLDPRAAAHISHCQPLVILDLITMAEKAEERASTLRETLEALRDDKAVPPFIRLLAKHALTVATP